MLRPFITFPRFWKFLRQVLCLSFVLLTFTHRVEAQNQKERKWSINGYVKSLQTLYFFDLDNIVTDNLLHHRFNFRWYPTDYLTFKVELRNRVFYGEAVKALPNYGNLIDDAADDVLDLSLLVLNKKSIVIHSMIDRAYLEWVKNDWELRLGRQRINWGINLAWTPNDLFNAYSYLDFDYEERPGSDALRLQYFTGFASRIELAAKAFTDPKGIVAAMLWSTNKWEYDFQLIGGIYHTDIALGGGWAGGIKQVGFKGEATYFHPYEKLDSSGVFIGSLGFDYSVKDWFFSGSYLFNGNAVQTNANINLLQANVTSPKNLYLYKHSVFALATYAISPVLNSGLTLIYSPGGDNAFLLNPSLTYSIKENWDIDLLSQLYFAKSGTGKYEAAAKALFFRLKWSY